MVGMADPVGWGAAGGPTGWDLTAGAALGTRRTGPAGWLDEPARAAASAQAEGPSFLAELARALQRLEGMAGEADGMAEGLLTGQVDDVSQVMIATEKARLAIELAMQLRNKAIEAYQEIMRMPV